MRKEYFWAIVIAVVVLVFSNAYVLYGVMAPKDGLSFLGRRVINSQDTYTYVAFIEQARQGRFFFENLYTTEPQSPSLVRPSYYFLGRMAALFGTSSIFMYHVGRIIFSILFFIVLYIFLGIFFKTPKRRLLAFIIVLGTSGVGFLVGSLWSQSADLWIPESNTFLSLQEAPHFILSQMLMLLSFLLIMKGWFLNADKKRKIHMYSYFVFSFLCLFLLGFEHPYDLILCTGTVFVSGVYLLVTKKLSNEVFGFSVGLTVLGCVIGLLYQYVQTIQNPILNNWAAQSTSPTPMDYLLGYGFLIIFGVVGLEKYLRSRTIPHIFIISWIVVTSILLYSPVFFQRRLSEAFHIPIAILATEGLIITAVFVSQLVIPRIRKVVSFGFIVVMVGIMITGTLLGVKTDVSTISNDNLDAYYYYLLPDEIQAMEWLRGQTGFQDVILSNWFYGNIIPGVTGRKVYLGHKAQTNNFDRKVDLVNQFILEKNADRAYKFLKDNHITYVYIGSNDSMLTYGFKPDKKPYLIKVYDQKNQAHIYRVR